MRFLRENSLSLFFGVIFLVTLFGQSLAGQRAFNYEELSHGGETISYASYVVSSHFGRAMLENWQSEWLQFALFALATVWLVQKGSNESKQPGEEGLESDQKQQIGGYAPENGPRWAKTRGWRTRIYSNSLVLVMLTIWILSWFGQGVAGRIDYNAEQLGNHEAPVGFARYFTTSDFWDRTLQNWQSEFLAVGSMAVLSIFLRQRGSPESKPVGASHEATGVEGG
jgi:hypothetical protein